MKNMYVKDSSWGEGKKHDQMVEINGSHYTKAMALQILVELMDYFDVQDREQISE